MKSVLQQEKECYICRAIAEQQGFYGRLPGTQLNDHHVFFGTANRRVSERLGLKVWLCINHHIGSRGVHKNREIDVRLKRIAQKHYEQEKSREEFIQEFGKSYL